ncbi:hypothetical protein [Streptomyces sp. NPDC059176]|uniref:hypothetical protein n=1 Tax=unclassified Streptomyces TaxID=2593676 RepID=UPI003673E8D1
MHTYDPNRQPYEGLIPSMRTAHDASVEPSPTPIYDALCSEYRMAFRTLPGDRSGEEDLEFTAFDSGRSGAVGRGGFTGQAGFGGHPFWHTGARHPHTHTALPPAPRRSM